MELVEEKPEQTSFIYEQFRELFADLDNMLQAHLNHPFDGQDDRRVDLHQPQTTPDTVNPGMLFLGGEDGSLLLSSLPAPQEDCAAARSPTLLLPCFLNRHQLQHPHNLDGPGLANFASNSGGVEDALDGLSRNGEFSDRSLSSSMRSSRDDSDEELHQFEGDYLVQHDDNNEISESSTPGQSIKRKANEATVGTSEPVTREHHRIKRRKVANTNRVPLFKQLESYCQCPIRPIDVYQFLSLRTQGESESNVAFLTRLFFAIGSPDALCQLRDILAVIREQGFSALPRSSDTMAETMQALDRLDVSAAMSAVMHWIRAILWGTYQRPETPFQAHSFPCLGRPDEEAYPDLFCLEAEGRKKEGAFTQKRTSLKNRLECGGNWHAMRERLSSGMLALVPIGGRFSIQNQRVEYLSTALFSVLLDALEEFRGHFLREIGHKIAQHTDAVLYQRDLSSRRDFETIDKDSLQRMAYDSADILALCEQAG
ncbi:hypothetical protein H2201_005300 [Coniosporium apollinis]|uniref:Spindle pole body component n=1 Tax=Coniosporium apollinis TaxID=61459 RepID=A0ABQ9NWZ9_9PEZI|nr:hypothetical protein H2201_005300 [Coniosporium apollinis]